MTTLGSGLGMAALLAAGTAAQTTWVVDDSGGADFTQIGEAIAAVSAWDVLVVMPGIYDPFLLDKNLTILGHPSGMPEVLEDDAVTAVQSPDGATLAGLNLKRFRLEDCAGTVVLDQVLVQGDLGSDIGCEAMHIDHCEAVLIQRSKVRGYDGDAWCDSPGIYIADSTVVLSDCVVRGGNGMEEAFYASDGRAGLEVEGESQVLVVRTRVTGGDVGIPGVPIKGEEGDGGAAIAISHGAIVTVRGNSSSLLQGGGTHGAGEPAPYAVSGTGELVISGVPFDPPVLGPGLAVSVPAPAEPFLNLAGLPQPGETMTLGFFGASGTPAFVAGSLVQAHADYPGLVDGTVWLDPSALLLLQPLTALGQEVPANVPLPIPDLPGLVGLVITLQAVADTGATFLATNPPHIAVR